MQIHTGQILLTTNVILVLFGQDVHRTRIISCHTHTICVIVTQANVNLCDRLFHFYNQLIRIETRIY